MLEPMTRPIEKHIELAEYWMHEHQCTIRLYEQSLERLQGCVMAEHCWAGDNDRYEPLRLKSAILRRFRP